MNLFKKFWPILFFLCVFLILFYKVIVFGQVFYEGDNFYINIPAKYFLVQQILQGHLPLWNPYLFLGIPYFADFNLGILNPTNLIYFLFPISRALSLLTIFNFLGLSIGMYILLRSYRLSKISATFGASIMSLSGMPFVLLGNMTFMQVIVYVPFLFLLARKYCNTRMLKWLLLLVGVQFLQLIAGHPQETYYTMFFISLYLLFFLPMKFFTRILSILFYLLFPITLSGVQILPFLEYVAYANRTTSITYAGWGGQTIATVVTFLFPTFYGSHVDGTWWGTQQTLVGFIGIPTLFFLFIGLKSNIQEKWYISINLLLSFFLSFGLLTPIFYLFYYIVPGWRLFRAPSGVLVFYTFFAAILVAFGIEYLKNYSEKLVKLGKALSVIGLILSIFLTTIYFFANKQSFWRSFFISLQNHFHKHIFASILFYDTIKIQQMFQGILWNIIFVSFFTLATGIILYFFSKKKYQVFLLLLITIIGFFIIDPKVIFTAPISFYDTGKIIPAVLSPSEKGMYRILSLPVDLHQYRQHLPSPDFFYKENQADLSIYQYNNNIERGLYQGAGYVSLVPRSFANFIGGENTSVTNIDFSQVNQTQLNLASVRYVLSYEPMRSFNNTHLELVESDKKRYVYKNASAFPRAYLLNEYRDNTIRWNKNEPTNLSFTVFAKTSDHVIVSDWYYPGWKASVNGKEVKISPYKGTFQEILVPKGNSFVVLSYQPVSLKIGFFISILSFGLLGMLGLFGRNKKL